MRALVIRAEAIERAGDPRAAMDAAEQALVVDPNLEAAHRVLMRCLAACSDQVAALRAYERCRRRLRDEVGVDPSPASARAW